MLMPTYTFQGYTFTEPDEDEETSNYHEGVSFSDDAVPCTDCGEPTLRYVWWYDDGDVENGPGGSGSVHRCDACEDAYEARFDSDFEISCDQINEARSGC